MQSSQTSLTAELEWSPRTQNQQIDKYPPLLVMDTNQFVIKTPWLLPAGGSGAGEND